VTGRRPPHAWFAAARSVPRGDVTAILLVVAAVLLVVVPTLTPTAGESGTSFFCVFCGSLGGLDFSLNLLLFMPLGAAMWNATGSWRHGVVAGFLLSVAIEALQYRVVAGRYTSMGDVLANTLGSWIGVWIATGSQRAWNATASTARRIATVAGIATALVVCGSALLLQPSRTRYPQWLQWSPVKKGEEPFRGRLDALEFNGDDLHRGDVLRPHRTLDSTTRSHALKATVSGRIPASQRPAIIARIANDWEEGFQLSQRGDDVAFRAYSVASLLNLRTVQVGLDDVLTQSGTYAGGMITVEAVSSPERIALNATRGHERITSVTIPRTIGLTWFLFFPWDVAMGPDWWPLNACWLAGLMLPISVLTARAQRAAVTTSVTAWWPLVLVTGTLVLLAPVTGLSQMQSFEWLGFSVGTFGGIALGWWLPLRPART